jgi:hypothetical protein
LLHVYYQCLIMNLRTVSSSMLLYPGVRVLLCIDTRSERPISLSFHSKLPRSGLDPDVTVTFLLSRLLVYFCFLHPNHRLLYRTVGKISWTISQMRGCGTCCCVRCVHCVLDSGIWRRDLVLRINFDSIQQQDLDIILPLPHPLLPGPSCPRSIHLHHPFLLLNDLLLIPFLPQAQCWRCRCKL